VVRGKLGEELVGEVVHLIRNERDELETLDETLHLVLFCDFNAEFRHEQVMELMRSATGRYDVHTTLHFLDGNAVCEGRSSDQLLNESNTGVNVVRLEPLKVEGATRKILHGCAQS
jgi:hypothetical protein